jgi:hypothetical protein
VEQCSGLSQRGLHLQLYVKATGESAGFYAGLIAMAAIYTLLLCTHYTCAFNCIVVRW